MPKVDGIELLRAIVDRKLCSCVVLLSDYSEFEYARQGIILGAFDYLPKPVDANEISRLLGRAKVYIDNERLEEERIRKLEVSHKDVELQLSTEEINTITRLICMGDETSLQGIEQLLNRINENSKEGELIRIAGLLKNSIHDILMELKKVFPYIELFIDPSFYHSFDDTKDQNFGSLSRIFMDRAKCLSHVITLLKLNHPDKGIVKQVCNFVLVNIDNNISLSMVADHLYMNKTYISESFKQKLGISFTEYVALVKMERAKVLILKEDLKTYEIADKLGYKDAEYFSKVFKKIIGVTPTDYRHCYEVY
jgi:two-component system response regulator YesN